ncbi:MAG: CDP-diacylglycerol--glycerol-3-phosphate 3-phosphatidyltransferase [Gammaproteobacteria bacterium]|nr:CDP-diacylglycerol--glycerol-3-phosphate 3-phosphatidyltransferase [Gammaproteobacteria bacterium]
MKITLPTALTLLRIAVLPLIVIFFYLPFEWGRHAAAWLFLIAALTDWLDGYLARRLGQHSAFGAFLDPVADKLLVVLTLVLLVSQHPEMIVVLSAIIIIGREVVISALREWMAKIGEEKRVAVSDIGKLKTVVQLTALTMMLYQDPFFTLPLYSIGLICLVIAAGLTLYSMVVYLRSAAKAL